MEEVIEVVAHGMEAIELAEQRLFELGDCKELSKSDWNKKIYKEIGIGKDNYFKTGFSNKFDKFKDAFIKVYEGKDNGSASLTNRLEQVLKQTYDALVNLYQF